MWSAAWGESKKRKKCGVTVEEEKGKAGRLHVNCYHIQCIQGVEKGCHWPLRQCPDSCRDTTITALCISPLYLRSPALHITVYHSILDSISYRSQLVTYFAKNTQLFSSILLAALVLNPSDLSVTPLLTKTSSLAYDNQPSSIISCLNNIDY